MTILKPVFAIILALLLAACARDMSLSASFSAPAGLAAGAPVYLGDARVGEVSRLTTAGGATRAALSVDPGLAGALRQGSAARVTRRGGRTAIELYNNRAGSGPLEDGDALVGLNNNLELAAWQAGEALDAGRQSVDGLSRSIAEYFAGDEWRQHKERMNRQMEDLQAGLGRSYEETGEIYRQLMKDLESESEAARQRALESYTELVRRLREQIARLREEGNEKLVAPLQRLLEDLSTAMERKPEEESA